MFFNSSIELPVGGPCRHMWTKTRHVAIQRSSAMPLWICRWSLSQAQMSRCMYIGPWDKSFIYYYYHHFRGILFVLACKDSTTIGIENYTIKQFIIMHIMNAFKNAPLVLLSWRLRHVCLLWFILALWTHLHRPHLSSDPVLESGHT